MKILVLLLIIAESFYLCVNESAKRESNCIATKNYPDPNTMISEGQAFLKDGDLVLRLNQDPISQFIKNFNRTDKSYSHAGIVIFEKGYPYIYHIVNGEENPDQKLRRDSLSKFCNPRKNSAFGIFRHQLKPKEINSLKNIVHSWYLKGVQFDSKFNFATNDRMYCSEMISKALAKATRDRIVIPKTQVTSTEARFFSVYAKLPLSYTSRLRIVSIDDLYAMPSCSLIKKYSYNQTSIDFK